MSSPEFVYETFIRASAAQVWEAITSPAFTRRYFHAMAIRSTWLPGSPVTFEYPDGQVGVDGEVLEAKAPERLVYTWRFTYDAAMAAEAPSRVIWELSEDAGTTRLRVSHEDFPADSKVLPMIRDGWAPILCSLKSLLETGEPLAVAGNSAEVAA